MVPEAEAEGAKARMLDWKRQLQEAKGEAAERAWSSAATSTSSAG